MKIAYLSHFLEGIPLSKLRLYVDPASSDDTESQALVESLQVIVEASPLLELTNTKEESDLDVVFQRSNNPILEMIPRQFMGNMATEQLDVIQMVVSAPDIEGGLGAVLVYSEAMPQYLQVLKKQLLGALYNWESKLHQLGRAKWLQSELSSHDIGLLVTVENQIPSKCKRAGLAEMAVTYAEELQSLIHNTDYMSEKAGELTQHSWVVPLTIILAEDDENIGVRVTSDLVDGIVAVIPERNCTCGTPFCMAPLVPVAKHSIDGHLPSPDLTVPEIVAKGLYATLIDDKFLTVLREKFLAGINKLIETLIPQYIVEKDYDCSLSFLAPAELKIGFVHDEISNMNEMSTKLATQVFATVKESYQQSFSNSPNIEFTDDHETADLVFHCEGDNGELRCLIKSPHLDQSHFYGGVAFEMPPEIDAEEYEHVSTTMLKHVRKAILEQNYARHLNKASGYLKLANALN